MVTAASSYPRKTVITVMLEADEDDDDKICEVAASVTTKLRPRFPSPGDSLVIRTTELLPTFFESRSACMLAELGYVFLKGLSRPIRVHVVEWSGET
jgi:hypothetical protein